MKSIVIFAKLLTSGHSILWPLWFLFALLLLSTQSVSAQREGDTWVFHPNTGFKFDENGELKVINSKCSGSFNSSCISDSTGSLLMYLTYPHEDTVQQFPYIRIKGYLVDGNHQDIENGANIETYRWMAKGSVILPWPEREGHYVLIYFDSYGLWESHLMYSEIQHDGTKAKVLQKNVRVADSVDNLLYSLASVRHCNGKDWWIIAHEADSENYLFYLLDKHGLLLSHEQKIGSRVPKASDNPSIPKNDTYITLSLSSQTLTLVNGHGVIDWLHFDRRVSPVYFCKIFRVPKTWV